jgi:hypothetical protein
MMRSPLGDHPETQANLTSYLLNFSASADPPDELEISVKSVPII